MSPRITAWNVVTVSVLERCHVEMLVLRDDRVERGDLTTNERRPFMAAFWFMGDRLVARYRRIEAPAGDSARVSIAPRCVDIVKSAMRGFPASIRPESGFACPASA